MVTSQCSKLELDTSPGNHKSYDVLIDTDIGDDIDDAFALSIEPYLFMAIRSIIMMGGSSGTPLPEWNVRSDAKAAQMVLAGGCAGGGGEKVGDGASSITY